MREWPSLGPLWGEVGCGQFTGMNELNFNQIKSKSVDVQKMGKGRVSIKVVNKLLAPSTLTGIEKMDDLVFPSSARTLLGGFSVECPTTFIGTTTLAEFCKS